MFEAIDNLVNSLDARFAEMPKLQWVNLLYRANFAVYAASGWALEYMWPGVDTEF